MIRNMYIRVENNGITSFSDTVDACRLSKEINQNIVTEIGGVDMYILPSDNPHDIYKKHEVKIMAHIAQLRHARELREAKKT